LATARKKGITDETKICFEELGLGAKSYPKTKPNSDDGAMLLKKAATERAVYAVQVAAKGREQ